MIVKKLPFKEKEERFYRIGVTNTLKYGQVDWYFYNGLFYIVLDDVIYRYSTFKNAHNKIIDPKRHNPVLFDYDIVFLFPDQKRQYLKLLPQTIFIGKDEYCLYLNNRTGNFYIQNKNNFLDYKECETYNQVMDFLQRRNHAKTNTDKTQRGRVRHTRDVTRNR